MIKLKDILIGCGINKLRPALIEEVRRLIKREEELVDEGLTYSEAGFNAHDWIIDFAEITKEELK